jgi:hypothetical protein
MEVTIPQYHETVLKLLDRAGNLGTFFARKFHLDIDEYHSEAWYQLVVCVLLIPYQGVDWFDYEQTMMRRIYGRLKNYHRVAKRATSIIDNCVDDSMIELHIAKENIVQSVRMLLDELCDSEADLLILGYKIKGKTEVEISKLAGVSRKVVHLTIKKYKDRLGISSIRRKMKINDICKRTGWDKQFVMDIVNNNAIICQNDKINLKSFIQAIHEDHPDMVDLLKYKEPLNDDQ